MTNGSETTPLRPSLRGARPLIFGEVLFDIFEDGSEVLGGAPFNVAWHLRGFGQNPLLISRVGADELGERALSAMTDWGLDTSGIQIDAERPTGTVRVRMDDGQPRYEILPEQAYDFIDVNQVVSATAGGDFSLFHHGTLAIRSPISGEALAWLTRRVDAGIFLDPNLRSQWWETQAVRNALHKARWAKLSGDELAALCPDAPTRDRIELAADLRTDHNLDLLVVTLGADGAFVVTESETLAAPAAPAPKLVDTVGAGDAFDAVLILALLHAWPLKTTLSLASAFAASICGIQGATPADVALYQRFLEM